MHVESPLPGNIWNLNLMLGERGAPLGPSRCVWGMMHLGHFPHPQTKIKYKLVTTVTKTGTLSRAHHVVASHIMWNNDSHRSLKTLI